MSASPSRLRYRGLGGPLLFEYVLRAVIGYAYGSQLHARVREARDNYSLKEDTHECGFCGMLLHASVTCCHACYRGRGSIVEDDSCNFFPLLGQYLIAFRFPQLALYLEAAFELLSIPRGMGRCHGCQTFVARSEGDWGQIERCQQEWCKK